MKPLVSVLTPTYRHATFIRRAIESLRAQTFTDWELVIVDDASPDDTAQQVKTYLQDERIRYHRMERNQGVGAALNTATALAGGVYIAYLPSDDVYYPDHLAQLLQVLETRPEVYLAYSGLRWNYETYGATLQGDSAVGREADALANPPPISKTAVLNNGNLFALVQVMHRRDHEASVRWTPRSEQVTDCMETRFWRGLLDCGATFAYTGALTCEWVDHPDQHHKVIAASFGGLSRYRQFYQIDHDEPLNWQPSFGPRTDEVRRFGRFRIRRELPSDGGLKVLIVGSLGFNPERITALEERGHKLYGLWYPAPESWDTTGPLCFGNVENIPYDRQWIERVRAVQPDVIYGLLNWQAIPMLHDVLTANLGIPFVFHFKEDPFICQEKGTWSKLVRLMLESDGQIFINREAYEWFQIATDHLIDPMRTMILDGDLPKQEWFMEDWSPKLSAQDGAIHTVCAGRVIGIGEFSELADAGIHIHFYGVQFHQMSPNFVREGLATGYLHLHGTVEPDEWVRELSQYDAAWFHIFNSYNGGDLRRAHRDDLNMPARLGTYAAAGLPWILKNNTHSRAGIHSTAQQYDVGVFFNDYADLSRQLSDRKRVAAMTANMRAARLHFAFDTYADSLIAFFRQTIERASRRRVNS